MPPLRLGPASLLSHPPVHPPCRTARHVRPLHFFGQEHGYDTILAFMPGHDVTAIILAAGVARRLAPLTDRTQKSLLHVGGRAILAWMLEALHAVGVRQVVIVVGHCADQVAALVAAAPPRMTVRTIQNPDYQKGSSLSLYCARDVIVQGPTLIMDADVVFPKEFLRRLVASPAANAFLIDRGFAD